ncbi:MAG TPA: RNA methyltransferase [Bacteroidota bacterium]|nr:RNA methyltransferase [Bacteroidota bacterium]
MRKLTHDEIASNRVAKDQLSSGGAIDRLAVSVLLDNIRSNYNVGSIFRSSDGARIKKLYLTGYTPSPPRKEIEKTALGATETVPWEYHKDPVELITKLKSEGVKICLLEQTTESRPYHSLTKQDFPLCVVVGNEITGVSPKLVSLADMAIDIPMHGHKQSLNVAVAYGIAIFEIAKILSKK